MIKFNSIILLRVGNFKIGSINKLNPLIILQPFLEHNNFETDIFWHVNVNLIIPSKSVMHVENIQK